MPEGERGDPSMERQRESHASHISGSRVVRIASQNYISFAQVCARAVSSPCKPVSWKGTQFCIKHKQKTMNLGEIDAYRSRSYFCFPPLDVNALKVKSLLVCLSVFLDKGNID